MESSEYSALVEKIISSKSFGRSDTYANLLRYLMEASIKNNVPKETTIASEIFGRSTFDPSQSTLVRVYVYNLRKKLKSYYQNEGSNDTEVLHIPKGGYRIKVDKRNHAGGGNTSKFLGRLWIWTIPLLLLLSLMGNLYWGANYQNKSLVPEKGLWEDLLQSHIPTMVVLGDLFIYYERDSVLNMERTIRDPRVNSRIELDKFMDTVARPGIEIFPATYAHLIQGSTVWIKNLTEIFFSEDKDYTIRSMSRFNPKELQDYNFIVVGMIKTLGIFNAYFQNSKFEYNPNIDALIYNDDEKGNSILYRPQGDPDAYHTDYGFMAKFPGPNNNTIYFFGGLWDTGATQSVKNFTDLRLLAQLEKSMTDKFGTVPKYYEVLFEVNGVDRMELSSEIVHLNKIDNIKKVWEVNK